MTKPSWDEMKARADGGMLPRKEGAVVGLEKLRAEVAAQERLVARCEEKVAEAWRAAVWAENERDAEQGALEMMRNKLAALEAS